MKKTPTGFVALCQCGATVGALDYTRLTKTAAATILGKWLGDGCAIEPRFSNNWQAQIQPCHCATTSEGLT